MIIACVFKESRTFSVDYVREFSNVLHAYHPEYDQVCLTDYERNDLPKRMERIPFSRDFVDHGEWFGKLELFRPDVREDLFYSDLDNVITSPLSNFFEYHLANPQVPFMIDDVDPNVKRLQSAVMYVPHGQKDHVWRRLRDHGRLISEAGAFGDAKVIRESPGWTPRTYQGTFHRNCVVSYRHGWLKSVREGVQVVCQHGKTEKPLESRFANDELIRNHFLRWR